MIKTITKTAVLTTVLASVATGAMAKDWIEKVEVVRDGIDIVPVQVKANSYNYTKIKSGSHRFLLRLSAKATNGERIVAMKVGSFKNVQYFEADGDLWSKSFQNRDVGAGTKRTVSLSYTPVIPTAKLKWQGWDPVQACSLNLDKVLKGGMKKKDALSKTWTVSAKAYFELDAVAAKKNKAEKHKWTMKTTSHQRDGYGYDVTVECLPAQ
ncbi:hypothetical protein V1T76_02945 [Roseibium sp. FZY0029]|uniref:hypothetical protein n=1 Tax=Roseibium sp. FZY0029 TaxID=3116647 RepID=UPI002ECF9EF1|nr:hypothetical protein [Roseibium sp. FZY0029]